MSQIGGSFKNLKNMFGKKLAHLDSTCHLVVVGYLRVFFDVFAWSLGKKTNRFGLTLKTIVSCRAGKVQIRFVIGGIDHFVLHSFCHAFKDRVEDGVNLEFNHLQKERPPKTAW